ncbi:oxidoreductase [Thiomonas sp.]|uniref:oxidoreductase n=1 Tax=Thiomonas sp. TaxID=2047785 RepID=UPI0026196B22|nr:oxidoreductase [Thiomonas sp.]
MASRSTPRTWFITGASSGFGAAFVQHALELGDNVVATARRQETIQALAEREPRRVLAVTLDVTRPGQADRAVQQALERFGHIDVLVNNAGYGVVGAVEETPEAELRAQMETNFFGAVAVMRAALPSMRAQRAGAIVNISSLGGQLSFAGFGAYSASKFALEGLSEALAQELAPFGIKVLIVEPGAFRTGFADSGALKTMPALAAYEDVVGGTRRFAQGMHGTQAGDPLKAARAVARALQAPETPLRLQLGRDAVDSVREHAQRMLRELAAWEAVAVDTSIAQA